MHYRDPCQRAAGKAVSRFTQAAEEQPLGCINDMAFLCEVVISDAGRLARTH